MFSVHTADFSVIIDRGVESSPPTELQNRQRHSNFTSLKVRAEK